MSSDVRSLVHPLDRVASLFIAYLRKNGFVVEITRTRSSSKQQARLYRRYLAGESKFPAAPPGHSQHELGRAFDMVVHSPTGGQEAAGLLWEQIGGRWGGRFKDEIHFDVGLG